MPAEPHSLDDFVPVDPGWSLTSPKWQDRFLCALVFILPALFILQPLLGPVFAKSVMLFRVVGLPLAVVLFRPRTLHWPTLMAFTFLVLLTGYLGIVDHPNDFFQLTIDLFSCIALFRFGIEAAGTPQFQRAWAALVHGVTLINLITLATLAAALLNLVDIVRIYSFFNRDMIIGLDRFSLGNAIEVPFTLTALLYAGMRCASRKQTFLLAAFINLVTAAISQSRLVVLIGLGIFIEEYFRCGGKARILSLVALVASLAYYWKFTSPVLDSILERFGGNDYGSAQDRHYYLNVVMGHLAPRTLLIGEGLTSSSILLEKLTGTFHTVEAVLLQLIYELGIPGTTLLGVCLVAGFPSSVRLSRGIRPIVWLLWGELLLLVPMFSLVPLITFSLGALAIDIRQSSHCHS